MADWHKLVLLLGAWLAYFAVHSLLASLMVKEWVASRWPGLMPMYRLFFNLQAILLLVPILVLTWSMRGPSLWSWDGVYGWLANGIALVAVAAFFWSLRYYDGAEFLGLRQLREHIDSVEDQESLHISPMHRFVRHPWYTMALVIIWTRDMDLTFALSSVAITAYFVVGSRLEERKLVRYHGEAYRLYQARVPGLVPRPWRYLDREGAETLQRMTTGAGGAAP